MQNIDQQRVRRPFESTTTAVNNISLHSVLWPRQNEAGPPQTLLMVHANGFHAHCWDRIIDALPEYDVIAVDLRGHGASSKQPPYDWAQLTADIVAALEQWDSNDLVAVGHSIGGFVVSHCLVQVPERFRAALLIDPVINHPLPELASPNASGAVSRRRNEFTNSDAMFERFSGKAPYKHWQPEVLRDYCDHGLQISDGQHYQLACPPEVEAALYEGAFQVDLFDQYRHVALPVHLLRARQASSIEEMTLSDSPTLSTLAAHFPSCDDFYYPEHGHHLPMEAPDLVVRHIRELVANLAH